MAHADYGAQLAFDRHLPFWRAHGLPMIAMCPSDSAVRTGLNTLLIGKRGHHSAEANGRFRMLLTALSKLGNFDRHVIFEYDSLCLVPELPYVKNHAVCGIAFRDDRPVRHFQLSNVPFEGKIFIHPPLIMTTVTILRVLESMRKLPYDAENGMWDRMLGLACERADIPVYSFREKGFAYSQNTIKHPHEISEACEAARNGAVLFHGIKQKEVLEAIVKAHYEHTYRIDDKFENKDLLRPHLARGAGHETARQNEFV